MTRKEVLEVVRKARWVKPHARVNFPYSVADVERILSITFTENEKQEVQKFYDAVSYFSKIGFSSEPDYRYNPAWPVIIAMCELDDWVMPYEADVLRKSLASAVEGQITKIDLSYLCWTNPTGDVELWLENKYYRYGFVVNLQQLRRHINLELLSGADLTDIVYELSPCVLQSVKGSVYTVYYDKRHLDSNRKRT